MPDTDKDLLRELEALGSEQTRKTYKRRGVGNDQYGVSYADLSKLQKKIKTDHDLARKLWASGVHDAQVLATMIADPAKISSKEIDKWSKDLSNYVLTDALAGIVSKTPFGREKVEEWTKSKNEWIGSAGWQVLNWLAQKDPALPESFFVPYLRTIQSDIHTRKNRVRYAMNGALIAIGARNDNLEKKALAVAAKIGKVEVDHGNTGCKTPDAAEYIANMVKRRQQRMTKTAKA